MWAGNWAISWYHFWGHDTLKGVLWAIEKKFCIFFDTFGHLALTYLIKNQLIAVN